MESEKREARQHIPVLFQETLTWAHLRHGNVVVDATVGFGGHAVGLLAQIMPGGTYVGIDKDERAIRQTKQTLEFYGAAVRLVTGQFSSLVALTRGTGVKHANLVLFDLGVASPQLDDPRYGISLDSTGELDMRIGVGSGTIRASDVVNHWSRSDLKTLFTEHGQPATNRIVERILKERGHGGIRTIDQLKNLIEEVAPRQSGIHPATRVYQALRVVVNNEYEQLKSGLKDALELLLPGGRLIVISFHSGEDRIVKQFMHQYGRDDARTLNILTKKPILASRREVSQNPRSRSAKMRVAEKIT